MTDAPAAGRRRIYLMRHGHVDYFAPEVIESGDPSQVRLTEDGRAQAAAAGGALAGVAFDIAVCSGLPRTVETAELVLAAQENAPSLQTEDGLVELRSGRFFTDRREELAARLAYTFIAAAQEGATFLPDGELFCDAYDRVSEAMERLLTTGDWKTGLVVAHEGVNRLLLGWATRGGLQAVGAFEQDLGCVNILDFDITPRESGAGLQIERAIVKSVNVTPYDYTKAGMPRTSLEHLFDLDLSAELLREERHR
ncbi:MAG: histidine phosphatase family protein [Pseudomonadota bacterium]